MRAAQLLRNRNEVIIPWIHTPSCVIASKELTPTAKLVYGTLLKYAPNDKDECWPGLRRISTDIGMERQAVMNALKVLEANQLISIERRTDSDGSKTSNLYTILPFPDGFLQNGRTPPEKASSPEEYEEDTPTYENHTTPVCKSPQEVVHVSEVKDRQPAPSVPLASLATQTTRAGGVVPLGGASAKPKSPPIDPNVVITKIREAKDGAVLTLESKECWTVGLAVWESLYGKKMSEADKRMFGNLIKDTSLELVARTFVDLLDGDILPPDWPYIIQCVGNRRNKDAYKQVKKDTLPVHDYYEVQALDHRYGFGIYAKQYFKRIDDENGNPILNSQGHTQFQQLKPFPRFNQ